MTRRITSYKLQVKSSHGFTLVEILVVIAIAGLLTSFMVVNLNQTKSAVIRAANTIVADVRSAQGRTSSGVKAQNANRCGYGIMPLDQSRYRMFAGPDPGAVNCATTNRLFDAGDIVVQDFTLLDSKVELKRANPPRYFREIFFEAPRPTTYIQGSAAAGTAPSRILIGPLNDNCVADPSKCRAVCVYISGRIEVSRDPALNCL